MVCLPLLLPAMSKDSILHKLQQQPIPEKQIQLLIDLSELYTEESQYDSAYYCAQEAIKIAAKNSLDRAEAEGHYALGYAYDLSGRLDDAVLHYENARSIYAGLDIKQEVANCMNAKGVAAYFKGDFGKALDYYLETLDYVEAYDIKKVMINTLNNLGVIYRITSKNQEAIDIYHKTLNLSRRTQNDKMVAVSFQNLGVAFNFEGVMDSAMFYLDKAVQQYASLGDTLEMGHTFTAIGETHYLSAQNYDQARENLLKGAEFLKYGSSQEELSKTYLLLARVERDDGNFSKAMDYFQKGLDLLAGTEREDVRLEFYKEMEVCYHKFNRPDSAYAYLKRYMILYTQIQTADKLKAIEELQTKYETEEKDKEIAQQEVTILKSQRQRNSLIASLFGLAVLGGFTITWLRRKHTFESQLAQREKELQREKIQKLQQEQKIMALDYILEGEEKERRRIAKDLHDSLGSLLTSAKIQLNQTFKDVSALTENIKLVKAQEIISDAADEVRRISHDMMPDALVNLGLQVAIEDLVQSIHHPEELKVSTYFFDLDEGVLSDQQQLGLYRIVQELTQNVLKHAQASQLIIQLSQEEEMLQLLVEDDGVGFDPAVMEKEEGIGLKNIRSRVQYLGGSMTVDSKPGGPTLFQIDVPVVE